MVEGSGDMPGVTSDTRRRWPRWAEYAASAWALAFAAVHLYWALGGTVGLPKGMSVDMNPALFVIDVLAVPLCVVGAAGGCRDRGRPVRTAVAVMSRGEHLEERRNGFADE